MSHQNNTEIDEMIDNACNELIEYVYAKIENECYKFIDSSRDRLGDFYKFKEEILKIIKEAKK